MVLKKNIKKYGLMTELKEKASTDSFYYADFETVQQEDVHYITSFSIVDTKQVLVASGSIDFVEGKLIQQSLKVIERFVEICFSIPSKNNIFYFHNFIKYDMFFLLNGITRNPKIEIDILSRDKTFYSVSVKSETKAEITFRDSMLMLSMSLQNLSDVYCVVNKKQMFDHINKYSDYSDPSFVKQLEAYCISDSKCLSEGFQHFRDDIKKNFKIDSFNCLTASSLALRIFRTRYYDSKNTPIFSAGENMDDFIRKSYYGGVVELYAPKMGAGFHYDLNALYPSIMKDSDFPIGEGKYVRGSEINLENFYGFVQVDVFSPYNHKPFLVMKDKRGLVAGIGVWYDAVYHSEELRYAQTLGYQFEIKGGYQFEKAKIFERFVDDLYALRVASGKSSALGKSLKIIMNALYGRFGMRLSSTTTNIVTHAEFQKINKVYDVETYNEINEQVMISYKNVPNENKIQNLFFNDELTESEYKKLKNKKFQNSLNGTSSIMISTTVTALARIRMHRLKNMCGDSLFYTDTDSIFTEKEFPSQHVSPDEIGKLKLEGYVEEAYFVSPKTYAVSYLFNKTTLKSKGIHKKHLSLTDYVSSVEYDTERTVTYKDMFFKNKKKFEIYAQNKKFTFRSNIIKRKKVLKNNKWVGTEPLIIF